ncbi:hypothetical protein SteCoe_11214 [Stentor coeruleus]|uniref:BTB domain-containing protein n=1 Tax=Stentor coeruleus TaxID=5963 RepID=A0A1R2CDP8_9CILI|nr:hypothetical protein SteCoe_11214 [Stentor coeruleus]
MDAFYNNPFLSDCQISIDDCQFIAHKLVLAAYSEYFNNLFKSNEETTINLPQLSYSNIHSMSLKEVFPFILKYMYTFLNSESTIDFLNSSTVYTVLSISKALNIKGLIESTEKYILQEILTPQTALDVLNQSILLETSIIIQESSKVISQNLELILQTENIIEKMSSIPYNIIKNILSSSEIKVSQEVSIYNFLIIYFTSQNKHSESSKISEIPEIPEIPETLKLELLKTIKWNLLTHHELLEAAKNPLISCAKDLILQGLSAQLTKYEEIQIDNKSSTQSVSSISRPSTRLKDRLQKVVNHNLSKTQNIHIIYRKPFKGKFSIRTFQNNITKKTFAYEEDYDNNGVLLYLATRNIEHRYQNPHEIGQVHAFGSDVICGEICDFVGRGINRLTVKENIEENLSQRNGTYLGVDFGLGRIFFVTGYSIRGSLDMTSTCLNWQLEGKNYNGKWMAIDRRIHVSGDSVYDSKVEVQRMLLLKRGAITTWNVADCSQGFRFFRIRMIGYNVSGNTSMALSNIEFYGTVGEGNWP